jgi:isoquinoline 1-oxidoreductase beta subunit
MEGDMTELHASAGALSRRSFIARSAAVAGGLSLGFHVPLDAAAQSASTATPEVNAWVVIRPDEPVVIRVARSEMGQGTLTGLAQLVAEELECDWARVTTEYPTPGQSLARNRVWGNFSTGGSRGVRESADLVRQGGATARQMLIQAAANSWGVPAGECRAQKSVVSHPGSGRTVTFGQVADAAGKLEPPKDVKLKDPKDWTIVGQSVKRLDTAEKLTGAQIYGMDLKLPGHGQRGHQGLPGLRRQGGELRRQGGRGHAGCEEGRPGRGHGSRRRGRHMVAGEYGAERPSDRVGRGPNADMSSEKTAEWLKEGLDARTPLSATRRVTPAARSRRRRRRSRRSTPTLTRTTRPWSR